MEFGTNQLETSSEQASVMEFGFNFVTDLSFVKAKFHYASLFGAGSELAPNRFGAC